MTSLDLRLCRSVLFLPASNARAIEKARQLPTDMLILDCEDAVRPEDKALARRQAVDAFAAGFGDRIGAIRINAPGHIDHDADIEAAAASAADFIVLPKAQSRMEIEQVAHAVGKPVIAMIETPAAVVDAIAIAAASAALIAGTNDLAAELGVSTSGSRIGLMLGLQTIVLAARAAGIAAFDGVYNRLQDDDGFAAQCREGRDYGFDGKTLIHPSQIATANLCFSASAQEIEDAQRLIAAANGGAERFEGRMIESMHVAEAKAILAKARVNH